jgi:tetratricopeptide (TPR) repeat protein
MKRRFSNKVLAALIVLAFAAAPLALAQAMGRISGTVKNEAGEPMEGVKVTVKTERLPTYEEVVTSAGDGTFLVSVPDATAIYEFTLEKEGYPTLKQKVKPQVGGIKFQEFEIPEPQYAETTTTVSGEEVREEPMREPADRALRAYNEGVRAFRTQELDRAVEAFEEALSRNEELTSAWSMLSYVRLQRGNAEKAVEAAERALELDPEDFKALNVRFQAYRQLGDEEKAEEAKEALKEAGEAEDVARRLFNEGVDLLAANQLSQARASFYEALSLDASLADAHEALADVLMRQEQYGPAFKEAGKVLAAEPDNVNMLRLRYDAARALGEPAKIQQAVRDLLQSDVEGSAPIVKKHAEQYFDGGQVPMARALLEPLVEMAGAPAHAHFVLALTYLNSGEMDAAVRHLRTFVDQAPDHPDAKTARGLIEAQK